MRSSTAYFAGVGTVVAAIAVGLGGGLTIANIMNPHPDNGIQMTKLERQTSSKPTPAAGPPAAPVPYLAATQPEVVAPAPTPLPAAEQTAVTASMAKPQDMPAPPAAAPPAAREQAARPDDAMAKARDADVKRAERNRSERHQQWADRRRREPRQHEQLGAQQPVEVEQNVRDDTEQPELPGPRIEFPQIRLFGPD